MFLLVPIRCVCTEIILMFKTVMNKIEVILRDFKNIITFFLGAIDIITFYLGADNYINNQIEKKITDEKYISKLARVLRPFSNFDKKGIIKYNHRGERDKCIRLTQDCTSLV